MPTTVCPHCGYNSAAGKLMLGATKGAGVAIASLINPVLGAVALTGLVINAYANYGKTEVQCPKCKEYYHA